MRINTNNWNKIRYTLYQPFYDLVGNIFESYRKLSVARLQLKPEDKVLIIGAGTGLDRPFLTAQKNVTAIDITKSMVEQLRQKARKLQMEVGASVMDGHRLSFDNTTFDAIILHLIVAVIPDPVQMLAGRKGLETGWDHNNYG